MKKISVLILFFIYNNLLTAQNLSSSVGFVVNNPKKARGISLNLEYQHRIVKSHFLAMGVSNIFTQSNHNLPSDYAKEKYILRTAENPTPVGSAFLWTDESFPQVHLKVTPNKYFDFNFFIKYFYQKKFKNNTFNLGLGSCITYHDEMEITEWLQGDLKNDFFGETYSNVKVPIFLYDTYLDFGLIPQIELKKELKNNLLIGISTKLYYFPKSKNTLLNCELSIAFPLRKKQS